MAHIVVEGTGVADAIPDRVQITFTLEQREQTADRALSDVARRSQLLEGILREAGIAESRWRTGRVSVNEAQEWDESRRRNVRRGFDARTSLTLTLDDPTPLGTLMTLATDQADARIAGPWWQVDPTNPAHTIACQNAARDARQKADAYASALNLHCGAVLEISEFHPSPAAAVAPAREMRMLSAKVSDAAEVGIHSGTESIHAHVTVTFALEPAG